jgi:alpha-tubulin suppressor-like RCC1 family protein
MVAAALTVLLVLAGLVAVPAASTAEPAFPAAYAWGRNTHGQLGDTTADSRELPRPVALPAGVTVSKLTADGYGSLALTADGRVYGWGSNQSWQLATTDLAVTGFDPVPLDLKISSPADRRIVDIAAGEAGHRLAVTSTGKVIAWGSDALGQVGNGAPSSGAVHTPVEVLMPDGVKVTSVAAGSDNSYAVTSSNTVYAWGAGWSGQIGNGSGAIQYAPVPVTIPAGTHILAVSAGDGFAVALTAAGDLLAWGQNYYGQLGNGSTDSDPHALPTPVPLPSGTTVAQVSAGRTHVVALTSTGRVLTWGGLWGATPTEISLPPGTVVRSVMGGGTFSMALTATGTVLAWGGNANGELGDGTTVSRTSSAGPVRLAAGTPVTTIAAGRWHAQAATAQFSDVTAGNPFLSEIDWLQRFAVTTGYADGTFRPTVPITRGQLAIYLYRYAHGAGYIPPCRLSPFPDVPVHSDACGAIAWLKTEGLTGGFQDGNFHPAAAVSRQAMAAFLHRYFYAGEPPLACVRGIWIGGVFYPFAPPFPDVSDASPFWCAISWLRAAQPVGITGGYADGNFRPTAPVSRQAMAAYLHRYFTDFHGFGAG